MLKAGILDGMALAFLLSFVPFTLIVFQSPRHASCRERISLGKTGVKKKGSYVVLESVAVNSSEDRSSAC